MRRSTHAERGLPTLYQRGSAGRNAEGCEGVAFGDQQAIRAGCDLFWNERGMRDPGAVGFGGEYVFNNQQPVNQQ